MKTTSVMQTLSGFSGRLSQEEHDFTIPQGGLIERSEGRVVFHLPLALAAVVSKPAPITVMVVGFKNRTELLNVTVGVTLAT